MERIRISPQQLRILKLAGQQTKMRSPILEKDAIYREFYGHVSLPEARYEKIEFKKVSDKVKASVHRSLARLLAHGYLERPEESGQYRTLFRLSRATWKRKGHVITQAGVARLKDHGIEIEEREPQDAADVARMEELTAQIQGGLVRL